MMMEYGDSPPRGNYKVKYNYIFHDAVHYKHYCVMDALFPCSRFNCQWIEGYEWLL